MKKPQLYVIRKLVMAKDIQEAIRLEKHRKPDEIFLDEEYRKANLEEPTKNIGFKAK